MIPHVIRVSSSIVTKGTSQPVGKALEARIDDGSKGDVFALAVFVPSSSLMISSRPLWFGDLEKGEGKSVGVN